LNRNVLNNENLAVDREGGLKSTCEYRTSYDGQ